MNKSIIIGFVLVALLSEALGHSYLTNPTSRSNQKDSTTGCRGPNCLGPCDRTRSATTRAPIQIQRGASISVEWPRNNHAGGFIRLAWAQTSQSDSHAAFDAGVQQINCHEVGGCKPDDITRPNSGDTNPADGSYLPCKTTIQVPAHLTNGQWTLQWAWFGGENELGDYYSCVDYTISGGSAVLSVAAAPVFKGGDFQYPGQQKCKYFNTDRLHRCVNEPCNNPVYPVGVEKSGLPYMENIVVSPPTAPATTARSTTASPTTARSTTARSTTARSTTGRSTTGRATTGASAPAGPSNPPSNPPPANPPTNPPASTSCTLGFQQCTGGSTFKTCGWVTNTASGWLANQNCPSGLSCHAHPVYPDYVWCY